MRRQLGPGRLRRKISWENLSSAQRASKRSRSGSIGRRWRYVDAQVCLGYRCERSSLEANLQAKAKMTEPARPTSPPWNTADDELLRTWGVRGKPPRLRGMKLNRTAPAVRARANRLNLRLKKTILKRQMG